MKADENKSEGVREDDTGKKKTPINICLSQMARDVVSQFLVVQCLTGLSNGAQLYEVLVAAPCPKGET